MFNYHNLPIKYLFHLTHISNLINIREYGLLSRNEINSKPIDYYNIADPEVLSRGRK